MYRLDVTKRYQYFSEYGPGSTYVIQAVRVPEPGTVGHEDGVFVIDAVDENGQETQWDSDEWQERMKEVVS